MKKALTIAGLLVLLVAGVRLVMVWRARSAPNPETDLRVLNGIKVDYLVTPQRVAGIETQLGPDFDVTSSGNIIVNSTDGLLELEPGPQGLTVDKINPGVPAPDSFALDDGAAVLTISGQFFGQLEGNEYSKAVPLPSRGMRLAPSTNAGTVFLFGGEGLASHRLYAIHRDGQLTIIADLDHAIDAVADNQYAVYVITGREIFRVRQSALELVIRLPENVGKLISIGAAPDDKMVFFSTENRVYALRGLAAISIVNDAGGVLRTRQGKLYLWDRARKLLVCIPNAEEILLNT